jgi:ABC-type transport system involved in cytochrome bd biosynthesis fused ATPase/permease subunit
MSGTLRYNLDMFSQHDDAELNDALRSAGLFSLQSGIGENKLTLDSPIASGGGNVSVGQRQIIALARAMIRGSKLLILDEATSAIGMSVYHLTRVLLTRSGQIMRQIRSFKSHCAANYQKMLRLSQLPTGCKQSWIRIGSYVASSMGSVLASSMALIDRPGCWALGRVR